ncbi:DUF2065 domain-containing protein [Salinisphaera sp. T31B1]|uniref:DUF2065 domain-containing protein n=1 Tax=Salinisphaera sp. T31B1 TaxID=727963 RepID=UPI0033406165
MWPDLLRALALVLVIEGLLPFLAPERWREMMQRASTADARSLRLFGGGLIAVGVVLLQFLH